MKGKKAIFNTRLDHLKIRKQRTWFVLKETCYNVALLNKHEEMSVFSLLNLIVDKWSTATCGNCHNRSRLLSSDKFMKIGNSPKLWILVKLTIISLARSKRDKNHHCPTGFVTASANRLKFKAWDYENFTDRVYVNRRCAIIARIENWINDGRNPKKDSNFLFEELLKNTSRQCNCYEITVISQWSENRWSSMVFQAFLSNASWSAFDVIHKEVHRFVQNCSEVSYWANALMISFGSCSSANVLCLALMVSLHEPVTLVVVSWAASRGLVNASRDWRSWRRSPELVTRLSAHPSGRIAIPQPYPGTYEAPYLRNPRLRSWSNSTISRPEYWWTDFPDSADFVLRSRRARQIWLWQATRRKPARPAPQQKPWMSVWEFLSRRNVVWAWINAIHKSWTKNQWWP